MGGLPSGQRGLLGLSLPHVAQGGGRRACEETHLISIPLDQRLAGLGPPYAPALSPLSLWQRARCILWSWPLAGDGRVLEKGIQWALEPRARERHKLCSCLHDFEQLFGIIKG